jgi:hypothetical protein
MNRAITGIAALFGLVTFWSPCQAKDEIQAANLLPFDLREDDGTGAPEGFRLEDLRGNGKVALDHKVFAEPSGPSLRINLPEEGTVRVDSKSPIALQANTRYLLSILIKVEDLCPGGPLADANGFGRGVFVYVHSASSDAYAVAVISGRGGTDGWVTLLLPFDTISNPKLEKVQVFLRCIGVSGTAWFQDPVLIEVPDGFTLKTGFILPSGETVASGFLPLT